MIVIVVTQVNWDGKGNDRRFDYHVTPSEFSQKMYDIHRGFNMNSTRVEWCDCGKGDYCPQFGRLFGKAV